MFCTKCGKEVIGQPKFCTNCGNPLNYVTPVQGSVVVTKEKLKIRKWVTVTSVIVFVLLIASVIFGGSLGKTLANWILGLLLSLDVLAMIAGVVLAIVYLIKASGEQGEMKHRYNWVALWWFFGPIIFVIVIILMFVILNVVSNIIHPV